jgi:hypothetical protein
MKLVNLTPHMVNLPGLTVPSEGLARVSEIATEVSRLHTAGPAPIPVYSVSYGAVTGLPEPVEGTIYLVSSLIRSALPERGDLGSPYGLVRDAEGRVIGAEGLVR